MNSIRSLLLLDEMLMQDIDGLVVRLVRGGTRIGGCLILGFFVDHAEHRVIA
jgi:hypothetical protein